MNCNVAYFDQKLISDIPHFRLKFETIFFFIEKKNVFTGQNFWTFQTILSNLRATLKTFFFEPSDDSKCPNVEIWWESLMRIRHFPQPTRYLGIKNSTWINIIWRCLASLGESSSLLNQNFVDVDVLILQCNVNQFQPKNEVWGGGIIVS